APEVTTTAPRAVKASAVPGPAHSSTRSPGSTSVAAAIAEVTIRPAPSMPCAFSFASYSCTVGCELLVTNTRFSPAASSAATAAALFEAWLHDGTLTVDERSLYLYRMDGHTLGVIGALGLAAPGEGDVLPHEHTTPKARSDRLDLLRATKANLSPVWGLSLANGLSDACRPTGASDASATDADGVVHSLWVLDDPDRVAAVSATIGAAPVVIA